LAPYVSNFHILQDKKLQHSKSHKRKHPETQQRKFSFSIRKFFKAEESHFSLRTDFADCFHQQEVSTGRGEIKSDVFLFSASCSASCDTDQLYIVLFAKEP
jgi:hypothetical protein